MTEPGGREAQHSGEIAAPKDGDTDRCDTCGRTLLYDFGGWYHADGFPVPPHRGVPHSLGWRLDV